MIVRFSNYILFRALSWVLMLIIYQQIDAQTINPPQLKCISIINSNSISLNWDLPENVNANFHYLIYASYNPNGPYNQIDSLPYYQTNYIHSGVAPANGQYFYFMRSCSLSTGNVNIYSISSDTLKTIMLNFNDNGDGTITLNWNSPFYSHINGTSNWYYILREYPNGVWTIRDSLLTNSQLLTKNDTIDICHATINYKVILPNSSGCSSSSFYKGQYLEDKTNPHNPIIDYVTVDFNTGKNLIKWQMGQSSDTKGYHIYKKIDISGVKIGSTNARDSTTFIHWNSEPYLNNETYYIVAFDSCGHTSNGSKEHNTMFLSISPDRCKYNILLSWNPYINMESGLKFYIVYRKINQEQFSPIDTLSPNSTFYYDFDITANYTYTYFIKAVDYTENRISMSNTQTLTFSYPRKPKFNYLRTATVKGNNLVEINAYIDTTAYIAEYHLYRIENEGKDSLLVQNLFHLPGTHIHFFDNTVSTNLKSYQYVIKLKDICNNEELLNSNMGTTIYLKSSMQAGMKNYLQWNKYESWDGGVNHYNIYRKTENGWDILPIATIASTDNDSITYIDDISSFVDTDGHFEYYVEAIEDANNPFGYIDTSRSNITSINQYPKLFVPNAFAPEGYNNIFLPIMGFVHPNDYLLQIYNRWGTLVFETNDKNKGWNGQYKNIDAPKGVYIYLIKLKNSNNELIEKRGTLTLIR